MYARLSKRPRLAFFFASMEHFDFLNCETETSILYIYIFFIFCDYEMFGLKVLQESFIKANKSIVTSRLSRNSEVHVNDEYFTTRPRSYAGHSPSLSDVANFKH